MDYEYECGTAVCSVYTVREGKIVGLTEGRPGWVEVKWNDEEVHHYSIEITDLIFIL